MFQCYTYIVYDDINPAELLQSGIEGFIDRAGFRDVEIDRQKIILRRTIELQLRRVTSCGNDVVTLSQTLLDKFIAEASAGSGDEEYLRSHCWEGFLVGVRAKECLVRGSIIHDSFFNCRRFKEPNATIA